MPNPRLLDMATKQSSLIRYRSNPTAYADEVLEVKWWPKQVEIAAALVEHKRVFVKASHSVGKSFLAGGLVNWFFDCFEPGIALTTAPNAQQVRDILWKEIRVQRRGRPGLLPKACRLESGPDHFAVGLTARDDAGFQGRHEEHVLIVFDEAVGVDRPFWEAAEGMMTGGPHCYWLALCNPTDTASTAFEQCQDTDKWRVIEISALDHPNIGADLADRPVPYPKAVRLGWIEGRLKEWCTALAGDQVLRYSGVGEAQGVRAGDFEFPPASGCWYRPGPLFESRVLGRWPTRGATAVWSEALWEMACRPMPLDGGNRLVIGCDVARFGDDFTSMIARRGPTVLHHESHNGWSTAETAGRLKQLARELCGPGEIAEQAAVHIDDDGVGGGVTDQAGGFRFIPLSGGSRANEAESYPNRRSECWFATAEQAQEGRLDLSRLADESRALLRRQLMAPTWKLDSQGRRVVEPKADTKRRIGRSPDDADALNLAFARPALVGSDTSEYARFWGRGRDDD